MKTTKSKLSNMVIAGSLAVNLAAIGALGYITNLNSKLDRISAYLDQPVFIYAPKSVTKPETVALVDASSAK